jgi:polyisoprenyl-teichoic acid--peptidoglycan teichoic acid transferase
MERNRLGDSQRRGAVLVLGIAVVLALIVVPACSLSAVGLLGPKQAQPESQSQYAVQPPNMPGDAGSPAALNVTPPGSAPDETPEAMPGLAPGQVAEPTPAAVSPWQGTGRLSILLLGIDQRPQDDPDKSNTDTMIVMTLDPATRTAGMLSIPRDLYVQLPNRGQDRINTAQAIGGPAYAMRTVQSIFGIPVQHYVRVNFYALTTLVDLVDGIDIYVDQDINDPTYPDMKSGFDPFIVGKGWHHMDGATALKYARTRHGSSDITRMRRQQQIIMALRDRFLSTDAIPRLLPNAPLLLNTLGNAVATDLSLPEMLQLILFAKDLPADKITRVVVDETAVKPWVTPSGAQVLLPIQSRIRELAAQVINPTAAAQHIAIQNATQDKALAATAQTYLRSKGYDVVQAGDARSEHTRSMIIDYSGRTQLTHELATVLGLPSSAISTTLDTTSKLDALVILGDDYIPQKRTQ